MYLYGAGGHARVIRDIVELSGGIVEGFIDDNVDILEKDGLPVIHDVPYGCDLILAIGDSQTRYNLVRKLEPKRVHYCTAIHPSAVVSPYAKVGEGTVIMPGAIVNAFAEIGSHCVVNTGASVGHEVVVGDYASVCPHSTVCGQCIIGEGTNVCPGAVVLQCRKIGRWTVIGAGSLVRHDVGDGVVVVGLDCHEIRKTSIPD